MRIRNCKDYTVKNYNPTKDDEGNILSNYNQGYSVRAYIYPLSGQMYLQAYGNELQYQYRMLVDEKYEQQYRDGKLVYVNESHLTLSEGDGVCVFGNNVDFTVKSIVKQGHLVIGLEMIH